MEISNIPSMIIDELVSARMMGKINHISKQLQRMKISKRLSVINLYNMVEKNIWKINHFFQMKIEKNKESQRKWWRNICFLIVKCNIDAKYFLKTFESGNLWITLDSFLLYKVDNEWY